MLWVPPLHWFIAVFVALSVHTAVIGLTFYRKGWKRGLIAIPVSLLLLLGSTVGGVAANIIWAPVEPVPLLAVLGLGAWVLHAITRGRKPTVSEE